MAAPVHARAKRAGRFYTDPQDSSKSYPSVTTILGALDKPALPRWAAKSAAEFAVGEWSVIAPLIESGDTAAAIDLIKGAPWRLRDKAASLGSAVHEAAEAWMLDAAMPAWADGVEAFMDRFVEWLSDFDPAFEMVEATVANPIIGYAGTLDAIVKIPSLGKTLLIDYKTGKGIYPEVALQLAAYRHATEIWLPNGEKLPMPKTDGAAVLHLRRDGYTFLPIYTDEKVFDYFQAACIASDWKTDAAARVLGEPISRPA